MLNYSPDRITLVFKGITITGFANGTFIEAERDNDGWTDEVGATGTVVRVKSLDRRGKITFSTMAGAPVNDLLSALIVLGEDGPIAGDVGAALLKDLNGTTLVAAEEAWLLKHAKVEYADTHTPRQWVLRCAEMKIAGGSALA